MRTFEPGSDEWWADRLVTAIEVKVQDRIEPLAKRIRGEEDLPGQTVGTNLPIFNDLRNQSRLNFADQLVSTIVDRDIPLMFNATDPGVRDWITAAWEASSMDVAWESLSTHRASFGEAFVTVLQPQGEDEYPNFHVTSPAQTIVHQDPMRPNESLCAVTLGTDPVKGTDTLMFHGRGYYRIAKREFGKGDQWQWDAAERLTIPGCPVVRFASRDGFGVFEKHTPALDRINHTILQRVVITVMQAFRQRAVQGNFPDVYPQDHPQAGETIDWNALFKAGPDALWILPKDAEMWESAMADIRPIIDAVKADLEHLAAATSTPLYVIAPDAANGSAAGAELSDKTFTSKMRRWQASSTASLRLMFNIARGMGGLDPVAGFGTFWQDANLVTKERAQIAQAAKQAGMSSLFIAENVFGLTPPQAQAELGRQSRDRMLTGLS